MRQLCAASVLLVMGLQCGSAAAMHPLLTDDAATAEPGGYEIELSGAWTLDRSDGLQSRDAGVGLALTWGMSDMLDLGVSSVYTRANDGTARYSGLTDSYITLKWRLVDADVIKLALVPYLALPTGDEEKGLGSGRLSLGCNLVASKAVTDDWNVNANLAWDHINYASAYDSPDHRHDLWRLSASLDTRLTEAWILAAEAGVSRSGSRSARDPAFATVGVAWSAAKAVDLSLGYRFALNQAETDHAALAAATFYW